ncbi:MAG: bifunctional UDP-sugar hydrolase/5'-nucleotidase [Pseudomonadota bacterium]
MRSLRILLLSVAAMLAAGCAVRENRPDTFTLTVIGSNDIHGELAARDGPGGLETFSGYVDALRAARNADGGEVLLIDAGDMWQGTLASNLNEGRAAVAAFNAMGYDAAAVGNHEFDFGPVGDLAIPESAADDPRGALKQRAREAQYPLLAANLHQKDGGDRWLADNVMPSVMLNRSGFKIGVIGVMTARALDATIAANVMDLVVRPLVPTIEAEARQLRGRGADLVIVAAHAGGRCQSFEDPEDLSSCRMESEIFRVAEALPPGLVDQIVAGHVHQGVAHRVNGIVITSAFSNTRAFDRVDYRIERTSGKILGQKIFPPQLIVSGNRYEGRSVKPNPAVVEIARQATADAEELKNRLLGVRLSGEFGLQGSPDSALGNLFTHAIYESIEVDIALQNVVGGLRQPLPAGELTYGDLFMTFPFDNRLVLFDITGRELRRVLASEARRGARTAGIAGVAAEIECQDDVLSVRMTHRDGWIVEDDDKLSVGTSDYLALGGANVLTAIIPEGGFPIDTSLPLIRDILIDWLAKQPLALDPATFTTREQQNWFRPESLPASCVFSEP